MTYTKSFPIKFDPNANPEAVVIRGPARFSVLTPRLLRLEYSPTGAFEDRPSQAFWLRHQPVPDFTTWDEAGVLVLETAYLRLAYQPAETGFTSQTLTVQLKETEAVWRFGDVDALNLGGTSRTLDNVDGALVLEEGLLSRRGCAVYDDTARLVFNPDGWLAPRNAPDGYLDLYFFGYGTDAAGCLADFAKIAGPAPMIPRWVLGNWWSRYWAYADQELLALMDEFIAHQVPLSICIVDMDWHITETGNAASGWTGYTWNRDLFPDPKAFIAALHERGLRTALNLHPADGVYPHEAQYADMARDLGIEPASGAPVKFDIADPAFTEAYFKHLHHPKEADGIDFWWMDWQQGTRSGLEGLDPLGWLNHLHYYDLGRDGDKRPFVFSRWGGLGNHRYPIGFSGDTVVTWDSLAFQPYFTATAANVNYGWWSHDIGGHMGGVEEPELYARWVQFGVFSPIFRLHCTSNPFHERRPWGWDAETDRVVSDAMRLRHRLIPYLYAMAWRNHTRHQPLVRPMYHDYPGEEPAYHCPDQYLFGSELLAAPFIAPKDPDVNLSRAAVWLPAGEWTDFFTGLRYAGDGWYAVYGGLDEVPVFARAGAVVPLAVGVGVANPDALEVHLFPGAANAFSLYEDDGLDSYSLTEIEQGWGDAEWSVRVGAAEGATGHLPETRAWTLCFRGAAPGLAVDANVAVEKAYDDRTGILRVSAKQVPLDQALEVTLSTEGGNLLAENDRVLKTCRKLVSAFRMNTWVKQQLYDRLPEIIAAPQNLSDAVLSLKEPQLRALAETILDAGYHLGHARRSQDRVIVLWNNHARPDVKYRLRAIDLGRRPVSTVEPLPAFGTFTLGESTITYQTGLQERETIASWFASLPVKVAGRSFNRDVAIQFDLTGVNAHAAYLLQREEEISLEGDRIPDPDLTITADTADWLALVNGETETEKLFQEGKIRIAGNTRLAFQFAGMVQLSPGGRFRPDPWKLEIDYLDIFRLRLDDVEE